MIIGNVAITTVDLDVINLEVMNWFLSVITTKILDTMYIHYFLG